MFQTITSIIGFAVVASIFLVPLGFIARMIVDGYRR